MKKSTASLSLIYYLSSCRKTAYNAVKMRLIGFSYGDWVKYFDKMFTVILGLKKGLSFFLIFEDEPLIRCRVCHFPSGSGKNIWEKFHVLEFDA
jgi:hypothetical protein